MKNVNPLVITLTILNLVVVSNSSSSFSIDKKGYDDPLNDPGFHKAFAEDNGNSLERKYTILVNQKSEDCYFIPDVKIGRTLTVDFVVTIY